ncbi:MAG: DNA translocase FtsK [Candidatus Eremiobacteraeota bacterium]|nr:DNA translocase FtsK [Candidatus Eremiobacteraeota bacterium]
MSEPAASQEEFVGRKRSRSTTGELKTPKTTRSRKTRKTGKSKSQKLASPTTSRLPDFLREGRWKAPTGAAGALAGFPFLCVVLTHPEWTGAAGRLLGEFLFLSFGQTAILFPGLVLLVSLYLLGVRVAAKLHPAYSPALFLFVDLLAARATQEGGAVGAFFDSLLCSAVGPAGSWLAALTGTLVCLVGLCQVTIHDAVEAINKAAVRLGERARLAWEERQQRLLEAAEEQAEPEPSYEEPCQASPAPEPPAWELLEVSVEAAPEVASEEPLESLEELYISNSVEEPEPNSDELLRQAFEEAHQPEQPSFEAPEPSLEFEPSTSHEPLPSHEPPPSLEPGVAEMVEEISSKPTVTEGVMEDPNGQLRLFPGPVPEPTVRYKLPPLTLLDDAPVAARRRPVEDKSQVLLDALDSFGVKASLLQIVRGPTVTRYELQPARGVKVSRFTSLTNDIALALASTAVRIEAPIPGKSAIGIEIPNDNTDLVVLKDILSSSTFRCSSGLTVALGKDLTGRPMTTNLQKMPHLLVAGTTGSGKSVCVNGLIISLLYRFTPRQLQIMMVDPKQVELSVYEGIPHLVGFAGQGQGEIIVEPKRAALALHQVVELMELRYKMFAENRVRNLEEYNQKAADPLPWFVVIIDELADLMMVASKTVETSICRIAQKARAAGIHLVLATQRPSADVITGLIKVNIPSRCAFAVSSQVDSRVILDTSGAEHLLGKGDMLFMPVDASDPRRIQGSYVGNDEIARVVEFWKGQAAPENLIELEVCEVEQESSDDSSDDADDELVKEALQVVLKRKQASASMLQTELKVGYARARRILMAMEKKGYVGPAEGSKPRKILYTGIEP